MSKLIDIINFYYENDLNEIYSSKTIDRNKTLKLGVISDENRREMVKEDNLK